MPDQQTALYERAAESTRPATLGPVLELLLALAGDARSRPHDESAADRFAMEFRDLMGALSRMSGTDPDLVPDLVHVLLMEVVKSREDAGTAP